MNITIGGKEYPVNFSLKAAQAMSERYGGMEHITEALSGGDPGTVISEVTWMTSLLVEQGVARQNILEGTQERAPSEEEVAVLMDVSDMAGLKDGILGAITAGLKRTVEVKAGKPEKNGGTTRKKTSSRGASTTG